jgi:hypothetical protein
MLTRDEIIGKNPRTERVETGGQGRCAELTRDEVGWITCKTVDGEEQVPVNRQNVAKVPPKRSSMTAGSGFFGRRCRDPRAEERGRVGSDIHRGAAALRDDQGRTSASRKKLAGPAGARRRFYFRLALELGFPDVDEFLRQIPARTLTEWETYFRLEPWGSDYSNKTIAIQTRLLAHYVYRKRPIADWPAIQQIKRGRSGGHGFG